MPCWLERKGPTLLRAGTPCRNLEQGYGELQGSLEMFRHGRKDHRYGEVLHDTVSDWAWICLLEPAQDGELSIV